MAIDIGNTHMTFGVFRDEELILDFRLSSDPRRTDAETGTLLQWLLRDAGIEADQVEAIAMASVVPPLTEPMRGMLRERFVAEPLVIEPGVKTGMPVLVDNPREVGADRIVNGVAAYEIFRHLEDGPHGVIVVDFGTATTFDVVSPAGEYLGGAIAPGIVIATEALFANAAKLPRVELVMPASSIGRDTVTSMQAGVLFGFAGLVEGMVGRMRGELDFSPRVVATGGLAGVVSSAVDCIERVEDFLTLEGLRRIWGRNQKRRARP